MASNSNARELVVPWSRANTNLRMPNANLIGRAASGKPACRRLPRRDGAELTASGAADDYIEDTHGGGERRTTGEIDTWAKYA